MNPYSDELRLLWTLLLNGVVMAAAYRFARRRGGGGALQALCDAFLLYFLTQYAAVALPGLFHILNAVSMTLVAAGAMTLAARGSARPTDTSPWTADHFAFVACALFVAGFLGRYAYDQRLIPPVATDALVYHLPTAVQWLQTHRLGIYPAWYWNPAASYSPGSGSMFMAWWMAPADNDVFVRFVQVPPLMFIFFLVARMCRVLGCSRTIGGLIAVGAALSRPLFSEAIFPKDDLFVTAFIAAGVLALATRDPFGGAQILSPLPVRRERVRVRAPSFLSRSGPSPQPSPGVPGEGDIPSFERTQSLDPFRVGIALGLVLASKYTALLACPIFLFLVDSPFKRGTGGPPVIAADADAGRRGERHGRAAHATPDNCARWRFRDWAIAISLVLLLAFPWYLRNILLTGNPLYPVDIHFLGLHLPGLFGTERDQQLRTAGGVWTMLASTYHSLPTPTIVLLLGGWTGACIVGGRKMLRDPLARACVIGSPLTLILFLATSPHHEVRYIFPLIVLAFAAVGLALARIPSPPVRTSIGGLIALAAALTVFNYQLIGAAAELAAEAALVAAIGTCAVFLQARVFHLRRNHLAALGAAAGIALTMLVYVQWHAYVDGYRESRPVAWGQPNGYPRQAPIWKWVDENVPADGSIACANTFFIYPYYGFHFTRHVGYAPTRRGLHDFLDFPRLGGRVPGDLLVRRMTEVMNADPDRKTWIENLRAMNAGYLVVMKHDPGNPDLSDDPPELRMARAEPGVFVPVVETDGGMVFRIQW